MYVCMYVCMYRERVCVCARVALTTEDHHSMPCPLLTCRVCTYTCMHVCMYACMYAYITCVMYACVYLHMFV